MIARGQGIARDGTIPTSHGVIGMMILHHPPIEGEEWTAVASKTGGAVVPAAAAGSNGRALAATASNGKTGMTGQTSNRKAMQRASNGKIGTATIGGQVTATRIRTPGQASNGWLGKIGPQASTGKHGKIGLKKMTASNGKIGPKQMIASSGQHGRIGLSSLTVGQTGLLPARLTGVWFEGGRACKGENSGGSLKDRINLCLLSSSPKKSR